MCLLCDGYTLDEVLALEATRLDVDRFLVPLVGSPGAPLEQQWGYTVGLIEHADHPELVIAGAGLNVTSLLLRGLAELVLDGERFDAGECIALDPDHREHAHVGAVHEAHCASDTFNWWHNLRAYGALQRGPLAARQIVLPADWDDVGIQPLLSDPAACVGHIGNRAQRRAGARRPRRPHQR